RWEASPSQALRRHVIVLHTKLVPLGHLRLNQFITRAARLPMRREEFLGLPGTGQLDGLRRDTGREQEHDTRQAHEQHAARACPPAPPCMMAACDRWTWHGWLLAISGPRPGRSSPRGRGAVARPAGVGLPKGADLGIEVRPIVLAGLAGIGVADVTVDRVFPTRVGDWRLRRTPVEEALDHRTATRPWGLAGAPVVGRWPKEIWGVIIAVLRDGHNELPP